MSPSSAQERCSRTARPPPPGQPAGQLTATRMAHGVHCRQAGRVRCVAHLNAVDHGELPRVLPYVLDAELEVAQVPDPRETVL